ncbi:hypothetical protein Tco_0379744, partial [Tanacetum coccineum]
ANLYLRGKDDSFGLTTLYRTNIIHRDKQFYLFPSHRFDFLPVDSNDGFVGFDTFAVASSMLPTK